MGSAIKNMLENTCLKRSNDMKSIKFLHILSLAVFFGVLVSTNAFARPPIDETFVPPSPPTLVEMIIAYLNGGQ
jgi:hypothetical protein